MHSTAIILLALGLLATLAMARPGRRPWLGDHESVESENSEEDRWSAYRLPGYIQLPRLLAGKLERPFPTFTAKKILDGKYLLISPALVFKLKEVDTDNETTTTAIPDTDEDTDESDSVETTTAAIPDIDESDSVETTDPSSEESSTVMPSFFKKRLFSDK